MYSWLLKTLTQIAGVRENAPEGQAVATEIEQLHDSLAAEMESLTALEREKWDLALGCCILHVFMGMHEMYNYTNSQL